MSESFTTGGIIVTVDVEATRRLYAAKAGGEADDCGCAFCRNYIAQRATVYPPAFLALLARLGADPLKENEPIGYALPDTVSRAFYQASFDFIGTVAPEQPATIDTTRGVFATRFKNGADYARGQRLADELGVGPVASLHCTTWLPWELSGETLPAGTRDGAIAFSESPRGMRIGFLLGRIALRCATYIRSLLGGGPRRGR